MNAASCQIVLFTIEVSALSTVLILPVGVGVGWLMARREWPGKTLVEATLMLPLFVPPVATGLVLLMLFGRRGPIGSWLYETFGVDIVFTWRAVVLACAVMSFPLLVSSVQTAFAAVNARFEHIARTLGANEWRVFRTISLPLASRGIIAGAVLAFARALGEFGATAVVAGMIPGKTMTLSLSIYQNIELGRDAAAVSLLLMSVGIVFVTILAGRMIANSQSLR